MIIEANAAPRLGGDSASDALTDEAQEFPADRRDEGRTDQPSLAWRQRAGRGLTILNPLSYTIAHAAALQADRVLGVIFNFVPPRFVADEPSAVGRG